MSSDIDICNRALMYLGANTINSFSDSSVEAQSLNTIYNPVRKALLRLHPWNFAMKMTTLASVAITPAAKYGYVYELPADCLRVITVMNQIGEWEVIGRAIYSQDSSMTINYVSDMTDPVQFDSVFEEILALRLAYEICYKVTQNVSMRQELYTEYQKRLKEGKQMDGQEGSVQIWDDGDNVTGRFL